MTLALAMWAGLGSLAALAADETAEPFQPPHREVQLSLAAGYDLHTMATAGPTLNRATQDVYLYGIRPYLPPVADGILGTAWSFFFTYSSMLWPHEFGHWARAQQVDSQFIFHNVNPLLPHTTVEMPASATYADSALLSVGGFEVNALIARQSQLDFYRHGGAWSDELGYGLINEMFFPIYAGLFPARAREATTWTDTRGDPVHFVLPVYQRDTGRPPVDASGDVDPALTRLYNESVILSLAWAALDPGFYQGGLALFDSGFDTRRAWMPVNTQRFGWTWGTQFNPSPLGYELTLSQYVRVDGRTFEVAVKHGRPMKNNAVRVVAPDLFAPDGLRFGAELEVWDQDVYGIGALAAASADVALTGGLGITGWVGFKSRGYSLGRALDQTPFGALGIRYRFAHQPPSGG